MASVNPNFDRKKLSKEVVTAYMNYRPGLCFQKSQALLDEYPNDLKGLYYKAISLIWFARYQEAETLLHRILEICPPERCNIFYMELGNLHKKRLAPKQAEKWYRKAIRSFPHRGENHICLGALFAIQGRLDEAEACHRRALECPEGPFDEAHLNLALVLRAKGQYQESMAHAKSALALDPKYLAAKTIIKDLKSLKIIK